MSGIIGVCGDAPAADLLIAGLRRLEHGGYDSAGLATVDDGRLYVRKGVGRVDRLETMLAARPAPGLSGIAHTRWATHGRPSDENAHPHLDEAARVAIVHNGVIENHAAIRAFLERQGVRFRSETDTEALAQLIGFFYRETGDLLESVRGALRETEGALGVAVACADADDLLVAARRGSPLFVGTGIDVLTVASDAAAFAGLASRVVPLEEGEVALLGPGGVKSGRLDQRSFRDRLGEADAVLTRPVLGGHAHHMLKEILEQPEALRNVTRGRIRPGDDWVTLGGLKAFERQLPRFRRALLFGCGTSWHAALIGDLLFEELAGLPSKVEYASELRYRNPVVEDGTLAVAISQSGETADTVAAMREVQSRGAVAFGVVNAVGSAIARDSDAGVYLHVGPEIGVASTKSFTAQVAALAMIALDLGRRRRLAPERAAELVDELAAIPEKAAAVLGLGGQVADLGRRLADRRHWLYLGRGVNFPVALEGALKIKEVSYLHAEGLPAAEMKHGPIAMIDEGMPVVVIAAQDRTYEKVLANIEEVRGRAGHVVAVATEGDSCVAALADEILFVPKTAPLLSPLLTVLPLQLLAYHTAVARGLDVDKPRSLEKSRTFE